MPAPALDEQWRPQYGDRAMMTASLLLSALGLLAVPGLLRPLARRLPPAEWAALCALLLAAGAIVLEMLAVLVAIPAGVRSALLRVAAAMAGVDPRLASFLTASTMAERIEALQADSRARGALPRRLSVYVPAALLLLGAPVLVGAILGQADALHHLAGICPSHPL